jgi:predicted lipoprotein with Yx(FWY)xxD motif
MRTMLLLLIGAMVVLAVPASSVAAGETVGMATAKVDGASKEILTNAKGMTLYYFTGDTATTSGCTGGCGSVWPALLSDAAPTAAPMLTGKLTLVKTANGSQVAYNGHLLYTYSRDQAPGDTNGNGIAGKWFAAPVDLKAAVVPAPTWCCSAGYGSSSGYGNGGGNGGSGMSDGGKGGY